jgi:hypothetical protein
MSERYAFRIPIGDWSDDGHGKVEWYDATASKPIVAVRDAYFAAKAALPDACCPEAFCSAYEDGEVPEETRSALKKAGAKVPTEFGVDSMAAIVVWFLNHGDPDLDVRLDGMPPPMLPFYGYDEQKRHIGFFGYGMFS